MISGVAGPAAVYGGIGSSEGACRDAEMTDDGWDSGDFDAAKILADGERRWNGGDSGDHHEFDVREAVLSRHGAARKNHHGENLTERVLER